MESQKSLTTVFNGTDTAPLIEHIVNNYEMIYNGLDVSPLTAKKYITDGRDFIAFLQMSPFNINTFRQYKTHLLSRADISAKTKRVKLVAASLLLKELYRFGLMPMDITTNTKGIQVTHGHTKDGLTHEEVLSVRQYIDSIEDKLKCARLKAIFTLLAYQGLRQFEICNLTVEDVNLYDAQINVKGKGRDDKELIDLRPQTAQALKDYFKLSQRKSGFVFVSMQGTSKDERLTERGFRKMFESIFEKLGIVRSVHGFRHYFVTKILDATNGDIATTQKFSRHKTIQAVMFYDDRKQKKALLPTINAAFNF